MKIALLTHHWVPNFGANLQAISTVSYLTKLGHEVTVLNYVPENLEKRYNEICSVPEQVHMHRQFCEDFMNQSPVLRTADELADYCRTTGFDLIVCGSDAILRLNAKVNTHEGAFPNPYWLTWATDDDAISAKTSFLSASCTGSMYLGFPKDLKKAIYAALEKVDFISVRDGWTRFMINHVAKGKLDVFLSRDPVSVLNEAVSIPEQFGTEAKVRSGKYILLHVHPKRINQAWIDGLVKAAHAKGLEVYGFPFPEFNMPYTGLDFNVELPLHPFDWYLWLKNAAGFIGERFHPMVCSLINEVPFIAVDHYRKRGIKGKFEWINIPSTSKVFTVCRDAQLKANCLHFPKLPKSSPADLLETLLAFDKVRARQYNLDASNRYKQAIDNILKTVG